MVCWHSEMGRGIESERAIWGCGRPTVCDRKLARLTYRVVLEATALQTLNEVSLEDLEKFSVEDGPLTELFPFSSR